MICHLLSKPGLCSKCAFTSYRVHSNISMDVIQIVQVKMGTTSAGIYFSCILGPRPPATQTPPEPPKPPRPPVPPPPPGEKTPPRLLKRRLTTQAQSHLLEA